ncbi:MAG: DUF1905 domain-containing protein [Sphingomonas bacterium]
MSHDPLLEIAFDAEVIHWRGPAPFFFAAVPEHHAAAIREAARIASYGWGCVPVTAEANGLRFTTSLFPRDGGYMVPLKNAVRAKAGITLGDAVTLTIAIAGRLA